MVRAPESANYPMLAIVEAQDKDSDLDQTGTDGPKTIKKESREKTKEVLEGPPIGGYNFLSPMN